MKSSVGHFLTKLISIIFVIVVVAGRPHAQGPNIAPASPASPASAVENGKKLYLAVGCWQCHGYAGQGGDGAKLAPNPIPYEGFARYVRKPTGQMPPYAAKGFPDSSLADVYAFLKSIPKAAEPEAIPLLRGN